ncbi:MAG: PIG-L family deacetylase [Clostridia bacterium]|nr:PIG-L family deacetylase [Clostridia bacterium]
MFDMIKRLLLLGLLLLTVPASGCQEEMTSRTDLSEKLSGGYKRLSDEHTDGVSETWHEMVENAAFEAADITGSCRIHVNRNGNDKARLTDDRYKTYWNGGGQGWIEFSLPEELPCYGVYVKWAEELTRYTVETQMQDGTWQPVEPAREAEYYNEYIPIGGHTHFRIHCADETRDLCINEVQLLGAGTVPDWVERWKPFEGEADLLVLSAHPDDEILWFGGTIPYYRGERRKKVLVVNVSQQPASRKSELLDCLWTCGVREYPIVTGGKAFVDRYASQVHDILKMWGEENLLQFVTGVIREYRPLVAVTHGFNGEYGHGAHKSCAYALTKCLELAADPDYVLPGSKAQLKPWQIRKVYIHLYDENQIEMNWRVPLKAFDSKTGFDVASEAFERHRTQHTGKYEVKDYGKYDNRRFGLYYSAVGPDKAGNDFFENITEERGIKDAE